MKENSINELLGLKQEYDQAKAHLTAKKEALVQKKEEIYNQIATTIASEINETSNNKRLQEYLASTKISQINFLDRSLNFMTGNNVAGYLTFGELLLLNDEVRNIGLECGVTSKNFFKIICDYSFYKKEHPFLQNEKVKEMIAKVQTLAYLDEIFKDINNILNYQGSFVVYQYVKRYLSEVLKEDSILSDYDLIYKDYNEKVEFVKSNLIPISSYLLEIRNQIPNSRLALCNPSLTRMVRKKAGTAITFEQNVFANGIAFGTTFEKLQSNNFEDSKSLIYIPHQNILK